MKYLVFLLTACLPLLLIVPAVADFDPDDYIDRDFIPMKQPDLPDLNKEPGAAAQEGITSSDSYSQPEINTPVHLPPRNFGVRQLPAGKRKPIPPKNRPFHVEEGGEAYRKGKAAYQAKRYRESVRWFLRGSDLGDVRSMITLGNMFEFGKVVRRDYVRAAVMYAIAAEKGNEEGKKRRHKIEAKLSSAEKQRVRRLLRVNDRSALIRKL